jgi:ATP-dependent helicase/nuclease subunit A
MRGSNLLVAAAAGSGKTAVLVERIIRLISDESRPVDVDQLLVATFTNAAAAEMRERIREALERELRERPEADHLRRQLALMNRAQITTLHSFCLEVIRRYFQLIPLDPGFRIANETEAQLIRLDVLEELLEDKYNECEEGDGFRLLTDWFGGDRGDDGLYRLVQQLYDQARSMPRPEAWLRSMAEMFHTDSAGRHLERWQYPLLTDIRLELQGSLEGIAQAIEIALSPGGPGPYLDNLQDERTKLADLLQHTEGSWDDLYEAFQSPVFGKLKACRGDHYDKELQEQVKKLRDQAKERWGKLREELFTRTSSEYEAELSGLSPAMDALVVLIDEFSQRYAEAKAAKGLVDFADLEHYCLRILRDPESEEEYLIPSSAAIEFQRQFVEILLDEYQDTNQVQEAIVALISREQPGNRFMVGDVKQSIYRFRLADPGLFLQKYRAYKHYSSDQPARDDRDSGSLEAQGQRIDLAQNFRSRTEVVDGVNFIFSQIMNEHVGEIAYDDKARLVLGAVDYPDPPGPGMEGYEADFTLIDRSADFEDDPEENPSLTLQADMETRDESDTHDEGEDPDDLNNAQLEARYIADRVQSWMAPKGSESGDATGRLEVWDKSLKQMRPLQYRDIVILLRATRTWSPIMIEELRRQGIPAYAELGTGYFAAIEIEVMLSLLKMIDNPYQDIPLVAVLRSPIFGLSAEQLAHLRIHTGGAGANTPFYDALLAYAGWESASVSRITPRLPANPTLREKIREFLVRLEGWRRDARLGALADLIWKLFDDTGYYDFVGGMPGGVQRQANLRALYDRARQYEATSFRGLFRFLRFIERMKETGGDLGTARALGEQEDVVRIMSIHKSKGLEFPVVFVAGLSKPFNRQDLNSHFLLHKDLGFGPKYIDSQLRLSYPSLPALAIRRALRLEMLAEELRVLYVALTRAREKLCLVATSRSVRGAATGWQRDLQHAATLLPEQRIAQANSFLDWLGPSLIRHRDTRILRDLADCPPDDLLSFPTEKGASRWNVTIVPATRLASLTETAMARQPDEPRLQALRELSPVFPTGSPLADSVRYRLSWEDPLPELKQCFAKTSVSELKRMAERQLAADSEATFDSRIGWPPDGAGLLTPFIPAAPIPQGKLLARRPAFMERKEPSAAERGTIYHFLMQHLPLKGDIDVALVEQTVSHMLVQELLAPEQAELIDPSVIVQFFRTGVGTRLRQSPRIEREVPFSYGLPASEVYDFAQARQLQDTVLIQGVIDCLFEEDGGWVLLDYKTDAVHAGRLHLLQERYRIQLDVYSQAVEHIWGRKVIGKYLYFFDGGHLVDM